MKMGPGVFWGIILIALGLSIIFKIVFGISMFRVIIAVLFILFGLRILIGRPVWKQQESNDNTNMFGEREIKIEQLDNNEYNTVFGKTIYDLRNLDEFSDLPKKVEFNTVFGHSEIYLPKDLKVKIKADAVFAAAEMPNGNTAAFGTTTYETKNDSITSTKVLKIEAHAVFGHISILQ